MCTIAGRVEGVRESRALTGPHLPAVKLSARVDMSLGEGQEQNGGGGQEGRGHRQHVAIGPEEQAAHCFDKWEPRAQRGYVSCWCRLD